MGGIACDVRDALDDPLLPSFAGDVSSLPMPELRRRRGVANEVETGYSYLRRLAQGRLDIVAAELQRRANGDAPGDVADLVGRLPSILADRVHAPGLGRLPPLMAPGELDSQFEARLDAIVASSRLASLPDVDDAELAEVFEGLTGFEREVSRTRRALHEVLDRIQEEIVRRYRDGEASVDDFLGVRT